MPLNSSARMSDIGAEPDRRVAPAIRSRRNSPLPQVEKDASYAPILKKGKRANRLDTIRAANFTTACAASLHGPAPSAHFEDRLAICRWRPEMSEIAIGRNSPGEIISAAGEIHVVCGEGTHLRLESVQLDGRKKISAREFANGAHLGPADRFV